MDAIDSSVLEHIMQLSGQEREHIGAIYQDGDAFKGTATVSTGQRSKTGGTLKVPKDSLRALFHNHPIVKGNRELRDSGGGDAFSDDDKAQAKKLGVPSYILTPSGKILKYDPATDETLEILYQLPVRTSGAHNTLVK